MKIALFSDVHANLPALEACFKSIDEQKPDAIYCLGDLVGYNVWPNEVIRLIRERNIATLAGNHDLKLPLHGSEQELQFDADSKNYAYALVGREERNYLLSLPAHIRLAFELNGEKINVLFVHGSPRSVNEYLLEEMEEEFLSVIMQEADADILCFGHSHKPYHRVLQSNVNGQTKYRHAINIGSVGKPKDNNPNGCYVLLHLTAVSSCTVKESIHVEFVRFAYDVEKAATAIEASPLPAALAHMLRKGY
jgi:putative phosphoesterase